MKEAENGHKSRHQPMYQVHNNSSSFYQTENRDERNTLNLYALTRACRQHLYLATRETSIWKVQSQIQYNLVMSSHDCDEFARLSVSHAGIELLSPITFGQNYEHCYGAVAGLLWCREESIQMMALQIRQEVCPSPRFDPALLTGPFVFLK